MKHFMLFVFILLFGCAIVKSQWLEPGFGYNHILQKVEKTITLNFAKAAVTKALSIVSKQPVLDSYAKLFQERTKGALMTWTAHSDTFEGVDSKGRLNMQVVDEKGTLFLGIYIQASGPQSCTVSCSSWGSFNKETQKEYADFPFRDTQELELSYSKLGAVYCDEVLNEMLNNLE